MSAHESSPRVFADLELTNMMIAAMEVGADLDTACAVVGRPRHEVERELTENPAVRIRFGQASARFKLAQFRMVVLAARNEKNWRAAVWVLERRFPEEFGSARAKAALGKQIQRGLAQHTEMILSVVDDEPTKRKIPDLTNEAIDAAQSETGDEFGAHADAAQTAPTVELATPNDPPSAAQSSEGDFGLSSNGHAKPDVSPSDATDAARHAFAGHSNGHSDRAATPGQLSPAAPAETRYMRRRAKRLAAKRGFRTAGRA